MTPRQALAAALTILGRDHILVAAGFTPAQAREGSHITALQMLAEVAR